MAELIAFRPIEELEFDKLLKFYVAVQIAVDESAKSDLKPFLLIAANVEIIVSKLPSREQMIWRTRQASIQLQNQNDEFVEFIDELLLWSRGQAAHVKKPATANPTTKAGDDKKDGKSRHPKGGYGRKDANMMTVQAQPEKKVDEKAPTVQEKGSAGVPGPKGNNQQKQ